MKNTIFVVTRDHGEEFYEEGYLGHTSSFDDYQTKVVFILFRPEAKPEVVEDLSSHLDLVLTIMDSLGVISPYEDYSQGISLLKREKRPYIIISGWDESAIIDDEFRIIFSTESYKIGLFEIRSRYGYKLVNFDVKKKVQLLREVVQKLSEFYR
jgi:membrane-anchored protein YejM (alkaline phosphatase superfamily)